MTRISRISSPRATLFAFALLAIVMLAFGAFSAASFEVTPVFEVGGEATVAGRHSTPATECRAIRPPCPHAARPSTVSAIGRDDY